MQDERDEFCLYPWKRARSTGFAGVSTDGSGPYAQSGESQMQERPMAGMIALRGATNDCRACQKGPKREPKRQRAGLLWESRTGY